MDPNILIPLPTTEPNSGVLSIDRLVDLYSRRREISFDAQNLVYYSQMRGESAQKSQLETIDRINKFITDLIDYMILEGKVRRSERLGSLYRKYRKNYTKSGSWQNFVEGYTTLLQNGGFTNDSEEAWIEMARKEMESLGGYQDVQSRLCAVKSCINRGVKICVRCKARLYCGKECQISDWSTHKINC